MLRTSSIALFSAVSFLSISACVATGPAAYGPAQGGSVGYSEARIEAGRYRVIYRGAGGAPLETVENLALRRAAEITRKNNHDWFHIVNKFVDGEERGGVSVGAGAGTGRVGRRSSVGVGFGGDIGRFGARAFYTVQLEILIGKNPKPEEQDYYDARELLKPFTPPTPTNNEPEEGV